MTALTWSKWSEVIRKSAYLLVPGPVYSGYLCISQGLLVFFAKKRKRSDNPGYHRNDVLHDNLTFFTLELLVRWEEIQVKSTEMSILTNTSACAIRYAT